MVSRKMTFTIPEKLAAQFTRRVPARERSRYVAAALTELLKKREQRLIHACEIANQDPDVAALEREFSALPDEIAEPWVDAKKR